MTPNRIVDYPAKQPDVEDNEPDAQVGEKSGVATPLQLGDIAVGEEIIKATTWDQPEKREPTPSNS